VAIQADGRIVVAGHATGGGYSDFAIVRYLADGSLDTSFGIGGMLKDTLGYYHDRIQSILIQPDGRIIAAGYGDVDIGLNHDFVLARYLPTGERDSAFGMDGIVTTDFSVSDDQGRSAILQPDGKIVVAGYSQQSVFYDFAVARFNTDGSPDSSFSSDGKLTTAIGAGSDMAFSVGLQVNGKIVAVGGSETGTGYDFALTRYNPNGSLDTTFGGDGKLTTAFSAGPVQASSAAIQADGRIVLVGSPYNGSNNADFVMARYILDCVTHVDASVTQVGSTLTSNAAPATYQWVSCLHGWYSPIIGATAQAYTATSNGSYAVIVSQNGCTDTSECYSVIDMIMSQGIESQPSFYPNPTNGSVTIFLADLTGAVDVEVRDVTGRRVSALVFQVGHDIKVSLDEPAGLYSIIVRAADDMYYRFMVVKE
jgi:uncharacterized delta-60 repeat protein